jgi:hypothetical protein
MYVRLSVHPHGTTGLPLVGFHEIFYFRLIRKSVEKRKISLKSDKNDGYLHEDLCTFMIMSRSIGYRMRNVSEKVVVRITTYVSCSIFFRNSAVYESMWKNMVRAGQATQLTV